MVRTLNLFLALKLLLVLQQLGPGLDGLQKPSLQPDHLPQNPNQPLFNVEAIGLEDAQGPSHSLHGADAASIRLLPQNQIRIVNGSAANTLIDGERNPSGERGEEALAGLDHLARVGPRGVEGDEEEAGGELGGAEGGDVGGGGVGEEVEGGGSGVEEGGEAGAEAAGGEGGGVEEGAGEEGGGGELVAGLVGVLEDEHARGGWDGVEGEHVAETHACRTVALGADGATLG